ncbi:hypothetical protein F9L16_09820 [Agarivorans sp. B2Z047]|uniref:hypothetical protein n=1 Tax=Agarivorans sp. B2Z047 TaxID=2652721 RepID=UPI00128DB06D|nr:hypothetical protein [Agarivorans sp. B2Z047]MPW29296.1 hypothetical protein [Agarivorans sp. B2Z047]UQN41849.1 hypothetical protein LQZ07_19035 [Agarivorans sp. B2Z047]
MNAKALVAVLGYVVSYFTYAFGFSFYAPDLNSHFKEAFGWAMFLTREEFNQIYLLEGTSGYRLNMDALSELNSFMEVTIWSSISFWCGMLFFSFNTRFRAYAILLGVSMTLLELYLGGIFLGLSYLITTIVYSLLLYREKSDGNKIKE